jgi:hypothetical protein
MLIVLWIGENPADMNGTGRDTGVVRYTITYTPGSDCPILFKMYLYTYYAFE